MMMVVVVVMVLLREATSIDGMGPFSFFPFTSTGEVNFRVQLLGGRRYASRYQHGFRGRVARPRRLRACGAMGRSTGWCRGEGGANGRTVDEDDEDDLTMRDGGGGGDGWLPRCYQR